MKAVIMCCAQRTAARAGPKLDDGSRLDPRRGRALDRIASASAAGETMRCLESRYWSVFSAGEVRSMMFLG